MADKQSSPWRLIILAIRQQLISCTGLANTLVRIVANTNYNFSYPNNRTLILAYSGLQPDVDSGVGRRARPCVRNIRLFMYTQSNTDMFADDLHAISDAFAHADFEETCQSALDEFWPFSLSTGNLTIEPLHIIPSDSDGMPFRPAEDDSIGLIRSELSFSCTYVAPNTAAVPTPSPPPVSYPE
jgi:hypothetical protein